MGRHSGDSPTTDSKREVRTAHPEEEGPLFQPPCRAHQAAGRKLRFSKPESPPLNPSLPPGSRGDQEKDLVTLHPDSSTP